LGISGSGVIILKITFQNVNNLSYGVQSDEDRIKAIGSDLGKSFHGKKPADTVASIEADLGNRCDL
jgi:hypothetical protein